MSISALPFPESGMFKTLWVYSAFIRNAFLNMLAYRLRYYTGIVTYFMFVSVHFFIWQAIFSGREAGEKINGFTLAEMVTYISIGWISRSLYFSNIDETMDDLVRTGQMGIYLLRPVNFQAMMLSTAVGESLFRAMFFTLPIGLTIFYFFPIEAPANVSAFLLFLLASVLGFFVLASLNFLVGLLSFWYSSVEGVTRAKYYIVQLFSGLLLPLPFFPDWLETTCQYLPFQIIGYLPLQFYLGKLSLTDAPFTLGLAFLWLLGMVLLGRVLWYRAFRRLTIQGG